jgi:uncharacterized membrane protein
LYHVKRYAGVWPAGQFPAASTEQGGTPCPAAPTAWWMALAFVLYGLTAVAFLAINVPPFQVPDEPAHFMRAAQIADGTLIGTRLSESGGDSLPHIKAGGPLDPGILDSYAAFYPLQHHPDRRATREEWEPDIHWSDKRVFSDFPNTVLYPPFFYLPSAIGVLAGRKAKLSVVQTLMVSRLLTGVTAVTLGAVAIAAAGGAAAWLFTILTLPMSLSLMASVSQDALLIACSALAGALIFRILRRPSSWNRISLVGVVVTLGMAGMARPPYAALAALPLGLTKLPLRWRVVTAALIVLCVAIWSLVVVASTWTPYPQADPAGQLEVLRREPLYFAHVLATTLMNYWQNYVREFIGVLGWLDTPLPRTYYAVAECMLGIAAGTAILGTQGHRVAPASIVGIVAGVMVSAFGMFILSYLTWTMPGSTTVEGIQGRYFLPLALVGVVLLPALGGAWAARLHKALTLLVLTFPLVSLAVVMRAIVLRYYLG